jgi:hypothetical protein
VIRVERRAYPASRSQRVAADLALPFTDPADLLI